MLIRQKAPWYATIDDDEAEEEDKEYNVPNIFRGGAKKGAFLKAGQFLSRTSFDCWHILISPFYIK